MFCERLNEARKQKGVTALFMANELGIGLRSYRNYESGAREPDLASLTRIADILNVSIDYLLCRDDFLSKCAGESGINLPVCPKSR